MGKNRIGSKTRDRTTMDMSYTQLRTHSQQHARNPKTFSTQASNTPTPKQRKNQ